MTRRSVFIVIGAVAAVVVLVITGILAFRQTPQDTALESSPGRSVDSSGAKGTEDPENDGYSSDLWGRQVVRNGDVGKPLGSLESSEDRCAVDPRVTIQLSHGAQTLWSTANGPAEIEDGIPSGYAPTATGAALAGWNYRILLFGGGEITPAASRHTDFSHSAQWQEFGKKAATPGAFDRDDTRMATLAPEAVRVLTCKDDFVVVEMAHKFFGDEKGKFETPRWDVMRFAMKWDNGDWVYQAQSMEASGEIIDSLEGWEKWQY